MQKRQYYLEPFLKEYKTTLKSCTILGDHYHVLLENTIFYPEGGGQPCDTGYINNQLVKDVYEKAGLVYHVLASPITGPEVTCVIDWELRFYHMQQHSGQHLLSAVLMHEFDYPTRSFHLGTDYTTIDIEGPELTETLISEIENEVNALICQNRAIRAYFVTASEADDRPLRRTPKVSENIRVVEIEGYDQVPCCGTHLTNTGQIGLVKIIRVEKHKKLLRVYLRSGKSALSDYQTKHRIVADLNAIFSATEDDLRQKIAGELEQTRTLIGKYKELRKQVQVYQAQEITQAARVQGQMIIEVSLAEDAMEEAPHLAKQVLALGDFFVLISMNQRIVLATNLTQFNCDQLIKTYAPQFAGRGGGKPDFAQAYFPTESDLDKFVNIVKEHLTQN